MQTQTLFQGFEPPPKVVEPVEGPFAAVAIEQSIDKTLDYSIPKALVGSVKEGQRVKVPLGRNNRPASGYVVGISQTSSYPFIKKLIRIEDERVLIPPPLMELARWIARYYCAPLGSVLESVLPSAVRKQIGMGYQQIVRSAMDRVTLQLMFEKTKATKRRSILGRLLQLAEGESIELVKLATEAGVTGPTVRKLMRLGVITITPEIDLAGFAEIAETVGAKEADIRLNEEQQKVFDEVSPRVQDGGFSVNLLLGVTGSGKTEVYLQCIRKVIEKGKRAIVLVPEIALTPQTVRRFTARFPNVAILHSGLSATQRHRYWQQISMGRAQVVVGARSAVFAPVPDLGVIVVDEEHESSYKQDQAPRYHARDVAIKRGQIEGVAVLLGSATPSLESYSRSIEGSTKRIAPLPPLPSGEGRGEGEFKAPSTGRESLDNSPHPNPLPRSEAMNASPLRSSSAYHLLTLPHRVRGLQMPHVELVDMKVENRYRRGVHLISQRLEHLLRTTVEGGRQAILLLNRRGYSNFVYCSSCTNAVQCKYCDVTMTYHRSPGASPGSASHARSIHTGQLHCHYCLAVNPLPDKCPHCGKKLSLFGLGTQRVEEELTAKFPELKYARVDSDTMRGSKDYEALLGRFARREIQVMLGTQMIAKGLDYPNVTLVGVISGDTALALPDFRAAERTFQLITQVAGRAGRGDAAGRVVLQTFLPDDPTIRAAIKQDYVGFARTELQSRRQVGLPPFARMVRIVLRDQDSDKLFKHCEELAAQLTEAAAAEGDAIRMKGPMPCAISRIAGYFRNQIVLQAASAPPLQRVMAKVREKGHLARNERIAVDVDPVSLL
jgi:primosomal protein N' (replication factor Y) (superfamily II helicase)